MKKLFIAALLLFAGDYFLMSQESEIKGKPIVELFTNLHYNLKNDTLNTSGFDVSRAYLGFDFTIDKRFSTSAIIDIGNPIDLSPGSKSRRYAHFREASVRYTGDKLTFTFGITGTRIFRYQQQFWGKRYVANTYQSINGYGFIADLGAVADYKLNDIISVDASLMNGEGYSTLQLDNSLKGSIGITISPLKSFYIRLYSDLMKKEGVFQNTLVGFIGYRSDLFYIGGEVSFKSNLDLTEGHHAWGISSTGGVNITKKNELFVRFDYSTSVTMPGEDSGWNNKRDGNFYVAGIQHTFNKYVLAALDYQSYYPVDDSKNTSQYIFLNLRVRF